MISIAVCDDNNNDINLISEEITKIFSEFNREIRIIKYYDPNILIENSKKFCYDLVFLDMAIPEINDGFNTAKQLKSIQPDINIVFVTSFQNTVNDVFFHKPVTFINKSVLSYDMQRYAKIIVEAVDNKNIYHLKDEAGRVTTINLAEIIYFESAKNYIKIYYKDKNKPVNIRIRMTLKALTEINSNKIVQIHRSFAVSMDNVLQLKGSKVICCNGEELSISKNFYDEAANKFFKYMR